MLGLFNIVGAERISSYFLSVRDGGIPISPLVLYFVFHNSPGPIGGIFFKFSEIA